MAKKWIINDNNLIVGNVQYHRDLLPNHKGTIGGGLWSYDKKTNTLLLYGQSYDFGSVSKESVIKAKKDCLINHGLPPDRVTYANEVNIVFTENETIIDLAIEECETIQKI
jgi:hypothetical protein